MEADLQERTTGGAVTKRDLVEQNFGALDSRRVDNVKITATAGGIAFASALEVMEFAKLMAMSAQAVPKDFRGNAGMCLAVTMQAVEWRMSPFQVASKSYVVNDRLAFESQLLHAIIEARAPLKERLNCEYVGEGTERRCRVEGRFMDGSQRFYESPMIKDIKTKNSPLWTGDPDQQLWYYSSRAWARKWCPDVIMGVYSRDELEIDPSLGRDEPPLPGLHARLIGSEINRNEGHKEGQAAAEIAKAKNGHSGVTPETPIDEIGLTAKALAALESGTDGAETFSDLLKMTEAEVAAVPGIGKTVLSHIKKIVANHGFALRSDAPVEATETPTAPKETKSIVLPRNPAEWGVYCRAWIDGSSSVEAIRKRWDSERQLRNTCGVVEDDRKPVQDLMTARCKELGE